ncbi:MAG TPA: type II toxin-antitoxin system RelE/ParE family toxin [Bradyrhizobium sp.]|nr:type II toxin-antitoxin system RelE/ParE family toxin [Bradyrhizobium sp.]
MRVIYTEEALANLDGILAYISSHYPTVYEAFQSRLQSIINRISDWPDSAQEVAEQPGVRVVPLIRYPYKVFYRNTGQAIEILYIHHAARDEYAR